MSHLSAASLNAPPAPRSVGQVVNAMVVNFGLAWKDGIGESLSHFDFIFRFHNLLAGLAVANFLLTLETSAKCNNSGSLPPSDAARTTTAENTVSWRSYGCR